MIRKRSDVTSSINKDKELENVDWTFKIHLYVGEISENNSFNLKNF